MLSATPDLQYIWCLTTLFNVQSGLCSCHSVSADTTTTTKHGITWNRRSLVETSLRVGVSGSTQSERKVLAIIHNRMYRGHNLCTALSIKYTLFSSKNHFPLAHASMLFWWCSLKSALCIFPPFLSCARLRTARQTAHRAKQKLKKTCSLGHLLQCHL